MNETNKRRGGFYWLDNEPYLSVTEILKSIDKSGALMYWFGREVYYAMVKDPSLSEKDALAMPYQASRKAMDRGSTIHSIVEAYKSTGRRIETVPVHLREYAFAFYDFMQDFQVDIIDQEKTLISKEHKIAGTLDMYAGVNGKKMILDIKTGKDIYMEAGLQMSAYAEMLRESDLEVNEIAVLLLETGKDNKPTGKYKFQTMKEDFDAFLAVKKLHEYINYEKLLKVGYLEN